jgi:hypothetical protein
VVALGCRLEHLKDLAFHEFNDLVLIQLLLGAEGPSLQGEDGPWQDARQVRAHGETSLAGKQG